MTLTTLSIPTVVWSGIVAAAISLAGVVLSNLSTARRLRMQLKHDADEKLKDRLSVLRKEVYLQLYSDITTIQGHLGALSSKDPTSPEFAAPVQAVNTQLAKVQLVGSTEVTEYAAELTALFTESLCNLMLSAKPLHELRTDISIADKFYNENLQEAQRINGEMVALNESGRPDATRMAALQRSFDNFREQYTKYGKERSDAWKKYNESQSDFVGSVKKQIERVGPTQARLMAAIKNEIGVNTDVAILLDRMAAGQLRMENAIKSFLVELNGQRSNQNLEITGPCSERMTGSG
ncbi:hypothetical protein [uncultured Xanthomonas sp.]|uniref:hypothetical protein n=1 Tax=uncultured Xanthomonas sp. TaxID=152831 RepID=UPI0025F68C81|nr:hypothetical protein [uncultured Xanthomonas sp.]